jgi:putative MATE family efflux protein
LSQQAGSQRLGEESIIPLLFKLSIPSIIAMGIQAFYNVVDSIYIGHVSKEALSALSLCFPVQMILIGIAVGTGVGTSSLISRLLGAKERQRACNTAEHAILASIVYGITAALAGIIFSKQILQLFTDDTELITMGSEYIKVILIGSTAMFFPMISNNILRGQGNTMIPMITMLIGAVLNIILDPLFIYGIAFFPEWGIKGAAFATILSRIISGSFMIFILFSKKNELIPDLGNFSFDFSIIKAIYNVGFPAMVMQFLASFMIAGMNKILASYSSTAIAAAGVYFRLQSFVFMPIFGLNQGYLPIAGYNYGHGNTERVKEVIKSAFITAFSFTTAGFAIFQLFPEVLIRMFNTDPELISIGTRALKVISFSFPVIGPSIVVATTFQAIGKGYPSMVLAFLRQLVLLLPLIYLLGKYFGLDNLWYAFPLTEYTSFAIAFTWLYTALKKIFRDKRVSYYYN